MNSENPMEPSGTRTADPLHAMQVLYQLSYGPKPRKDVHSNKFKDLLLNIRNSYITYRIDY